MFRERDGFNCLVIHVVAGGGIDNVIGPRHGSPMIAGGRKAIDRDARRKNKSRMSRAATTTRSSRKTAGKHPKDV